MPFRSKAQQGYMEAHRTQLEKQGVDIKEWEQATDYKNLPAKKGKTVNTKEAMKNAGDVLGAKPAKKKGGSALKEMTIRKAHKGGYIAKHRMEGAGGEHSEEEYVLPDKKAMHSHIDEHYEDDGGKDKTNAADSHGKIEELD